MGRRLFEIACARCGSSVWRPRNQLNRNERDGTRQYCGIECLAADRRFARGPRGSLKEKLEANGIPEPNSGCTLWLGDINDKGYARLHWDGRKRRAHRLAYELAKGPVPKGLLVLHKCDVPACVNPDHLFVGTFGDNNADMWTKGRARSKFGNLLPARSSAVGTNAIAAIRQQEHT